MRELIRGTCINNHHVLYEQDMKGFKADLLTACVSFQIVYVICALLDSEASHSSTSI